MKALTLVLALGTAVSSNAFVAPGKPLQSTSLTTSCGPSFTMGRSLTNLAVANINAQGTDICPLLDPPANPEGTLEVAMGWFWGPQRDFDNVDVEGILDTVVGYTGSHDDKAINPTYQNVQDYAEALRVTFDPDKISYEELLNMVFSFATPSDPRFAGTQYRSAVFYHTPEQKKLAEEAVKARGRVGSWVAVEPASDFYRAEEYHQKYIDKQITQMHI